MGIDPDAVGSEAGPAVFTWDSKDCLLYALGVGAGTDELAFTTENTAGLPQAVLPSFAVIAGSGPPALHLVGEIDRAKVLHGEQGFTVSGAIPAEGSVSSTTRITGIHDKGKNAVIAMETTSVDTETGETLFTATRSAFVRDAGGFGGDRGDEARATSPPDRPADHSVSYSTTSTQALIYRLSGDRNPLHSDPAFARRAGFDRPILHGLCTYGFTARALLNALCSSDPSRFRSMRARFTSVVYPGDDLTVEIWTTESGAGVFRTIALGDDAEPRTVIDQGHVTFAP